jgi:8-hydroxy-5-deazaflavin:NADPH oxidoreductase
LSRSPRNNTAARIIGLLGWGPCGGDATNAIDLPAFAPRDLNGRLSTEVIAGAVSGARVVKAFNTLPAAILGADPAVLGGRRVLFVSSDDTSARATVVDIVERLGFAAVDLGGIAEGGRAQQFGGGVAGKDLVQLGGNHRS